MSVPVSEEPAGHRWTWVDLRLVPVAATVWLTTLAAPAASAVVLGACAAGATGLAGVVTRVARGRRPAAVLVVLAVLAGLAVTAATAAVRTAAREGSPLRALAERQAVVEVELELDGDPHRIPGAGAPRIVAEATVRLVSDGGMRTRLRHDVVLFGPAEDWLGLLPDQAVRVRVAVSPVPPEDGVVARLSARGPPQPLGDAPWVQRVAGGLRDVLADSADRVLGDPAGGLLPGLVVGDTRAMDPVLVEEFRRAGLAHLTAVSGANVAIVLAGVLAPLRRRGVDPRVQAAVAVVALLAFVLLARPTASVLRAATMGAVTLLALATGRSRAAVPALGAAVVLLLLVDPGLARDAGFALSVAATAAIVLLAPRWSRRLRGHGWPPLGADAVSVAAAAGLATAPLVAGLSGIISPVSLPANLLAAPVVAPATVLGLLAALVGAVVPPVGDAFVWLAGWPTRWLVLVAQRGAALPDGAVGWPAGTRGAVLLTVLLLAVAWVLWRFPPLRALALAALVGLAVIGWPVRQALRGWPPEGAVLVACDVGQGDALVVPTGPGEGLLVDGGPGAGAVDRCLDRLDIDRLPLVLISHLDADHVGGLPGALAGREVGVVATGALSPADDRAGDLRALVRRAGARSVTLVPGDRRSLGSATVEVLAPPPEIVTAAAEPNDLSLVVRVVHRGVRLLLTGDLGGEAQARLARRGVDLRADVLKVPHHGSGDAAREFLAATGARVALVSAGRDNPYGHPAAGLLRWLAQEGMRVHRTDRDGDLAVVGSADGWGVATRGVDSMPVAGADRPGDGLPAAGSARARRTRVGACGCGSTPGPHLPPARRRRGGGAAALPGRGGRARRRPRAPPRGGAARAAGTRPAGGPAG